LIKIEPSLSILLDKKYEEIVKRIINSKNPMDDEFNFDLPITIF
jgi:hypothetical protein